MLLFITVRIHSDTCLSTFLKVKMRHLSFVNVFFIVLVCDFFIFQSCSSNSDIKVGCIDIRVLSPWEAIHHFGTSSVPKANSSHPLLCENLSVCFLSIHHTTYYAPHLDIYQMSHVQLLNPSFFAFVPPLADDLCPPSQCPKMGVSFRDSRARPCLLHILIAEFRQEHFFPSLIRRPQPGQRLEGVGRVAKESTNKEKPLVLSAWHWFWGSSEQRSTDRLCYRDQTRSKFWRTKSCTVCPTICSFK